MGLLVLGLVLFLGTHSISIVAPAWRDAQVAARGEKWWKAVYALLSLVGFVLLVKGYGLARQSPLVLYQPPLWMHHVTALLMLPVFPLFISTYFPGRIQAAARHPTLVAAKLWAFAHLLSNGTLADVLLFGGFLAWAVADRISMKHRPQRPIPGAPPRPVNDLVALGVGLALYAAFVFDLHLRLIGVSPFAGTPLAAG